MTRAANSVRPMGACLVTITVLLSLATGCGGEDASPAQRHAARKAPTPASPPPEATAGTDVDSEVHRLLDDPVVSHRINQMREMNAGRLQITVERLTQMLLEDRALAQQSGQYAAAVAATVGLAQLHGKIPPDDGRVALPDAEAAAKLEADLIQFTARRGQA